MISTLITFNYLLKFVNISEVQIKAAIKTGNCAQLEALLDGTKSNRKPKVLDKQYLELALSSKSKNRLDVIQLLLSNGASPNQSYDGHSLLNYACATEVDASVIRLFVNHGVREDSRDSLDSLVVCMLSKSGSDTKLITLLSSGRFKATTDHLQFACLAGKSTSVSLLVKYGAEPFSTSEVTLRKKSDSVVLTKKLMPIETAFYMESYSDISELESIYRFYLSMKSNKLPPLKNLLTILSEVESRASKSQKIALRSFKKRIQEIQ